MHILSVLEERPKNVLKTCQSNTRSMASLGHPQDIIFQRLQDVGRERPLDVGRGRALELHRGLYGDVFMTSSGRNFADWD